MTSPMPTDEELVTRIRDGDRDAARVLFERHFDSLRPLIRLRLRGAARRRVGESDVIQEAYVAVLEHVKEFVDFGPGSYRRWLQGILVHKVKDALKQHTRRRRALAREVYDVGHRALVATDETPSAGAARVDERRALWGAIGRLAAEDGTILRLVHGQGYSFVEIAACTGRTPDAVRKTYGRALARLVGLRGGREDGR